MKRFEDTKKQIVKLMRNSRYCDKAARDRLVLTKHVHTLELMRWYGKYLNKGKYNQDSILNILALVKEYQAEYKLITSLINNQKYPSADQLLKMASKKIGKKDTIKVSFELGEKEKNPDEEMNEDINLVNEHHHI